ncbi:stress response protein NST1-like [Durio zibethinus]|uniref:Stress response protein NST1-like n=1 Tax=Durio zibethinus TaxID=66656 RepID=A0A6P5Z6T0_DURZI|nr:stress response protein NST1-like [Durio zibethinus]
MPYFSLILVSSSTFFAYFLQVQRERVKAERKKKKEKRRRKKEKKKESEQGGIWRKKQGHHKRDKRLRSNEGKERSENQGKSENETEEMETSSLTEEFEQPIPESLYESSDNSQSIRRKRNSLSCNECHNHGSLVQIDFQLEKHKTPEALPCKPDCSTRMMDSVVQKKLELHVEEQFYSASIMPATDVQEFVPPALKDLCHSSQRARLNMDEKSEMTQTSSQFKELVVNWIPPSLQIEHFDVGDQEWLFERNPPRSHILKTSKSNVSKDVLHHGNSMSCHYDLFLLHYSTMDPTPVKEQISSASSVPDTDAQELATQPLKVLCHSSSQGAGIDTGDKVEIAPTSSCSEIGLLQIESQFRELVVNWLLPSLQFEPFEIGDQEWLFKTKQPRSDTTDTSTASYDALHQGNFTRYPHAQYLPQANMYALPYTILY